MLSICIPLYNFDVNPLISQLYHQMMTLGVDAEIIILDDGSSVFFPMTVKESTVHYHKLERNIGRSKCRNQLAKLAKFEYLLFLDCDSIPVHEHFLKDYIEAKNNAAVVCGGTKYKVNDSSNLRVKFGIQRETINKKGSFFSNNFLIKKSIFDHIRFEDKITEYGHEDTIFGMQVLENGHEIKNINNPVYHTGIESNDIYVQKVERSLENLIKIRTFYPKIIETSTVLKTAHFLTKFKLSPIIRHILSIFKTLLKQNLLSKTPNLLVFDLYKLHYILTISADL